MTRIRKLVFLLTLFTIGTITVFSWNYLKVKYQTSKLSISTYGNRVVHHHDPPGHNVDEKVNGHHGPKHFSKPTKPVIGCKNSNLEFLSSDQDEDSTIPKIVHWIFADKNVPQQYEENIKHCQAINSDHTFIFWSDASVLEFIKKHYSDYLYLFKKDFKSNLEFSDATRYFILGHYGGVYMDMDVKCVLPFSKGLKPYQCIIDRERETQTQLYWGWEFSAMNSVMGCQRKHPFFLQAQKKLKISAATEKGTLARTGPYFLTQHFLSYNKTELSKTKPVILAPWTLFSPLMDENHIPMFRGICNGVLKNGWQRKGCADFKRNGYSHGNVKELTKDSIAIHQYKHLGWGSWKHQIVVRLDICKLVGVYIYNS